MNNLPNESYSPGESRSVQRAGPQKVAVHFRSNKPYITYMFLGLTVFVYLLQMLSQNLLGGDLPAALGMKVNSLIQAGQIWRLITPVLLHGSLMHIFFNMYALYVIGRRLEIWYGNTRFLLLYLAGGFAGNVFSFLLSPVASLGASTAIFGMVAGEAIFFYHNRSLFGNQARSMIYNSLFIIAINLVLGFTSAGIDNWGHLGGLVGGLAFGWFASPQLQVGGLYPDYYFVDQRNDRSAWLTFMLVILFFFLMAAINILKS